MFLEAINHDQNYEVAYAFVAWTYMIDLNFGWAESLSYSFEQADKFINKSTAISDTFDLAHVLLGYIHLFMRQFDEAVEECKRAIMLNPNGAEAHLHGGIILSYAGDKRAAIHMLKRTFRLNPIPPPYYYFFFGMTYRNVGLHEEAIDQCKKGIEMDPDAVMPYITLVASSVLANRHEEAKAYAQELLRIDPDYFVDSTFLFKDQSYTEVIVDALRKAGLPD